MSSITRIADTSVNANTLRDLTRTSLKMEENYRHITTGTRMASYKDAGDDTARILNLENTLASLERYEQSETAIMGRLKKMEVIVRQINDIAVGFRARVNKVVSFGTTDTTFQGYCQKQLEEVQRLLNSQDPDQRYLFGGYETTSPPVDVSLIGAPAQGDPVSKNYYLGTTDTVSAKISDQQELHYGIHAAHDGFAKLIHALKIGASTTPNNDANSDSYQKLKNDAIPIMEETSSIIPDILQDIGTSMRLVEQAEARKENTREVVSQMLADLKDADQVQSMFQLGKNQVALQFSMIAHQRIAENIDSLLSVLRNG